jgi:hypothetical protein
MECDDGVEREYIKIVIDGVDPTAIFKFGVSVALFHYYTDGYTGTLNDFGVETGKKEFMDFLKTKNDSLLVQDHIYSRNTRTMLLPIPPMTASCLVPPRLRPSVIRNFSGCRAGCSSNRHRSLFRSLCFHDDHQ